MSVKKKPNIVKTFQADFPSTIGEVVKAYSEEHNLNPIHTSTATMVGGNKGYIFVTVTFETLKVYD